MSRSVPWIVIVGLLSTPAAAVDKLERMRGSGSTAAIDARVLAAEGSLREQRSRISALEEQIGKLQTELERVRSVNEAVGRDPVGGCPRPHVIEACGSKVVLSTRGIELVSPARISAQGGEIELQAQHGRRGGAGQVLVNASRDVTLDARGDVRIKGSHVKSEGKLRDNGRPAATCTGNGKPTEIHVVGTAGPVVREVGNLLCSP